jgi:hyperosmotically inducible periplasmic protein
MTARTLAIVVSAVAIIGTGCNWRDSAAPAQSSDTRPAASKPPGQADAWLTTQVQARYFGDAALRDSEVDVSTDAGVVTLSGRVPTEAARAQAVALAKQVDGVTRVEDELEIIAASASGGTPAAGARAESKPSGQPAQTPSTAKRGKPSTAGERFDAAWTTTKIQAQYFIDPDVKGRKIDVTTLADGTVTLRGAVESEAARADALRLAKETEGVRQVVDELRIEPADAKPPQSTRQASEALEDGWITAKIQSKYFLDPEVKGREIDVDTRNGVVTLSGKVGSPAERRQAVAIARNTDGVRDVTDQLTVGALTPLAGMTVKPGRILEPAMGTANPMDPPDQWITTTIQSKFYLSDEVRDQDIAVGASRGVVTLEGRVDTEATKKTAATIAQETRGVSRVVNQLTVGEGTA